MNHMSDVLFSIQAGDDRPIYRQIVEQVKSAIASARLRPGDKLPTHRDMAREIVVAPLTVKKAYDILEMEGLIIQEQGRGSFVSERPGVARADAQDNLRERAQALVRQARIMGLDVDQVGSLLATCWEAGRSEVQANDPSVARRESRGSARSSTPARGRQGTRRTRNGIPRP